MSSATSSSPESLANISSSSDISFQNIYINEYEKWESPSASQFEQIRHTLKQFVDEYRSDLDILESFVCTCFVIDKVLTITIGISKLIKFNIPTRFKDTPIRIYESFITQSSNNSCFESLYDSILLPGSNIGSDPELDSELETQSGSLGGIFKIDKDDKRYGMTCSHVLFGTKISTQFKEEKTIYQPSHQHLSLSGIDITKDMELASKVGVTGNYNVSYIENGSWIDYSLFELNSSRDFENKVVVNKKSITLIDRNLSMDDFIKSNNSNGCTFAKRGSFSDVTIGRLHNSNKEDCHVKFNGATISTYEYSFCSRHLNKSAFATTGDSGSLVFKITTGDVFGQIFATASPCMGAGVYLTFVTPLSDIKTNFKQKYSKDLLLV